MALLDKYAYIRGKVYALPITPSVQLLFYRKDLFENTGIKRLYQEKYKEELKIPDSFEKYNQIAEFFTNLDSAEYNVKCGASVALGNFGVAASEFLARFFSYKEHLYDENGKIIINNEYQLLRELPADKAIKVEFKEVQHADDMKAYGMILSSPDEKIYYSGDAAYLLEEIAMDYLSGKISRIYHDTSSKESTSHCYYKRLEKQIPVENRKRVYCMHLDGEYDEMLKESGFSVVEVG